MARLSLSGLADLVSAHWSPAPGDPLVLPSFLGRARQDANIALQHQLLGRGRLPWLTLIWRDGVMPYDQRTLDARIERHGASGFFVEVLVEEPDLDLNVVEEDPALRRLPYWAIRCTKSTRNGRLGSLRSLRDATYRALRIEYEQLSEELGLDVERWSIAEPLLQAAIDPASVLVIVDGLIDIQLQSVPAQDQQVRLVARTVVDELAHVPPSVVAGLLSIAAGKSAPDVDAWLEAAFLYREGQLRRWAAFLGHADVVDAVVTAFDERASRGQAEAKELKSAVKALSTKSRQLRIDLTKSPELGRALTLLETGQIDDAEREVERLQGRIDESGATSEVKAYCAALRHLLGEARSDGLSVGGPFREALRLLRTAGMEEPAAIFTSTRSQLLSGETEFAFGEAELRAALDYFGQQDPRPLEYFRILGHLVLGLAGQGRLDDAERELRDYLTWRQATGLQNSEGYSEFELLADILETLGVRQESADVYQKAITAAQRNGSDPATIERLEGKLTKLTAS
ncbi:MAG: hypothetical protein IV100_04145 [Myxococcales bacterium]|nr:hypothetical protein [Myxococcales bacterium]